MPNCNCSSNSYAREVQTNDSDDVYVNHKKCSKDSFIVVYRVYRSVNKSFWLAFCLYGMSLVFRGFLSFHVFRGDQYRVFPIFVQTLRET